MLDLSRFELLTFDCYGTLINWEEGILRCLHRILAAYGKDTDDATILRLYGDFEARAEQGEYCRYRDVLQFVVRQFGDQFGFAPTDGEVRSLPESRKNGSRGLTPYPRSASSTAAFDWPLFPTWMTISSLPRSLSLEWSLVRSSRPNRQEPISRH